MSLFCIVFLKFYVFIISVFPVTPEIWVSQMQADRKSNHLIMFILQSILKQLHIKVLHMIFYLLSRYCKSPHWCSHTTWYINIPRKTTHVTVLQNVLSHGLSIYGIANQKRGCSDKKLKHSMEKWYTKEKLLKCIFRAQSIR